MKILFWAKFDDNLEIYGEKRKKTKTIFFIDLKIHPHTWKIKNKWIVIPQKISSRKTRYHLGKTCLIKRTVFLFKKQCINQGIKKLNITLNLKISLRFNSKSRKQNINTQKTKQV